MVLKLDLFENYIGPNGGKAVAHMMKENCYIMDLVSLSYSFTYVLFNFVQLSDCV